jgi:hypothetical protein
MSGHHETWDPTDYSAAAFIPLREPPEPGRATEPGTGASRSPVYRRAGVRQPERRPGAGVLRGRHRRGHPLGPVAPSLALRHRPAVELLLQGPRGRGETHRSRAGGALRGRGSVRKSGNRVRVAAQLIEAETGAHIWADRYERDLGDIFALQDEITERIVAAIKPSVKSVEVKRARAKTTENLSAYDFYLRALSHYYPADRGGSQTRRNVGAQGHRAGPRVR